MSDTSGTERVDIRTPQNSVPATLHIMAVKSYPAVCAESVNCANFDNNTLNRCISSLWFER
eukprot:scaffold135976_cov75-Attheya_sp.AAC.1